MLSRPWTFGRVSSARASCLTVIRKKWASWSHQPAAIIRESRSSLVESDVPKLEISGWQFHDLTPPTKTCGTIGYDKVIHRHVAQVHRPGSKRLLGEHRLVESYCDRPGRVATCVVRSKATWSLKMSRALQRMLG